MAEKDQSTMMDDKAVTTGHDVNEEKGERHGSVYSAQVKVSDFKMDAIEAEKAEHNMGVIEAIKAYPMAAFWAFVMSSMIIMESYDVFLANNFLALDSFQRAFGTQLPNGTYNIPPRWTSAFSCSGQLGALIGVFVAGPLTTRVGYRWATIAGLMLLNAFIFVFYFANSLGVLFAAQILEGIPWGIFIANAPAYCSEIVPIQLRAPCTQMLQMFWAIGSIIVGAVTYSYQNRTDAAAYRLPIALQWMFPTPLAILMFFAPESPWWLVRKGKYEQAAKSISRLGRKSAVNQGDTVAMMRRTIELEKSEKPPSYMEMFKATDLRRTLIVAGVYASQNLTGNLIANQAVYFFTQAGIDQQLAFGLGLITSALQMVFVMLSWILTAYFGRRSIYLWGSLANFVLLIALGIAGSVTYNQSSKLAQAALGLIVSVLFTLGPAPASWVIIGETSAIRLRPLTTGFGRAIYYIVEIPCIFLAQYMLNPQGVNLRGECGYVWGATALICLVVAWWGLPEMKGRSYREIDILFKRRVPARKFKTTEIDLNEDE